MDDAAGTGTPEPGHEPPTSPPPAVGGGTGLPDNVAGALCYILGPITGILFFILDRQRAFVRFHAVQCLALTVAWFALWVVLMVVGMVLNVVPILGAIVGFFLTLGVSVAGFALWLWLMYQAYQGNTWAIPGLAPHVRRIAAESAS